VWKHRNFKIFDNVCNRILRTLGEIQKENVEETGRVPRSLRLDSCILVGFFDREFQNEGLKCGAGVVLKLSNLVCFKVKINRGLGTNSRGEILAL